MCFVLVRKRELRFQQHCPKILRTLEVPMLCGWPLLGLLGSGSDDFRSKDRISALAWGIVPFALLNLFQSWQLSLSSHLTALCMQMQKMTSA